MAAGDSGSSDGVGDGLAHVDFPASSPHALACGGTRLHASGTKITNETAWDDDPNSSATGGGVDPSPKPLRRYLQKLKHLSRDLTRKQRGSRNRAKAKTKLARLHRRIADIRGDALHKLTTSLMRYRTIAIEDLNVCGMLANRCLSRAIGDLGFFEFRRQLEYKAAMAGSSVIVAARWYPSSRLCSSCAAKNETLALRNVSGRAHRAARPTTATTARP